MFEVPPTSLTTESHCLHPATSASIWPSVFCLRRVKCFHGFDFPLAFGTRVDFTRVCHVDEKFFPWGNCGTSDVLSGNNWGNWCGQLYLYTVLPFSPYQRWWLFPHLRGFLENGQPFIPHLRFYLLFFLSRDKFVNINSTLYARMAERAETTVAECSLTNCVWARFPHCLDSGIVSPLCWVKGVCVFKCNLPPALFAEWPGSFMCHCSYTGGGTDIE